MTDQVETVQSLRGFFEAMSAEEPTSSADRFHDPFLSIDPATVAVIGREQLRGALPAREKLFASVGAGRAELQDVEVTVLDGLHVLASTRWAMATEKSSITLESTYLLRREGRSWTAVVYLNHHDIRQLLQAQ